LKQARCLCHFLKLLFETGKMPVPLFETDKMPVLQQMNLNFKGQ